MKVYILFNNQYFRFKKKNMLISIFYSTIKSGNNNYIK